MGVIIVRKETGEIHTFATPRKAALWMLGRDVKEFRYYREIPQPPSEFNALERQLGGEGAEN